ncbi:MAG: hypothetical protein FWC10_08505 [Lentimicrobiaceae bacterium]|nr:hypothetical protein [Lentimicrobiaceae bacterium]
MKNLLKLAVFLLIFSGVASSCNPEPDKEYPQNISFTEYSLPETSCHWVNLLYDDKVLMINSNDELEKYISCAKGSYPAIDFSKHTLLLASGKTTNGISDVNVKDLQQLSATHYQLNMKLLLNTLTVSENWSLAFVISKIKEDNRIDLNVTCQNSGYPIDIPFEIYTKDQHLTNACKWLDYSESYGTIGNELYIINNDEEMKTYYVCSEEENVPDIDFSQYTLLLARGKNSTLIKNYFPVSFVRLSRNDYAFKVLFTPFEAMSIGSWWIAVLTHKLDTDINIKLIVEKTTLEEGK